MEYTDVTYFCLFSPTGRQNVRDYVMRNLLTVLSIPHFSTELVADSLARPLDPAGDIIAAVVEASVVACGGYMDLCCTDEKVTKLPNLLSMAKLNQ